MSNPHGDDGLQIRIDLFQLVKLIDIACNGLIPRIPCKCLPRINPGIAKHDCSIRYINCLAFFILTSPSYRIWPRRVRISMNTVPANIGKCIVDMRDLGWVDIRYIVVSPVRSPGRIVTNNFIRICSCCRSGLEHKRRNNDG